MPTDQHSNTMRPNLRDGTWQKGSPTGQRFNTMRPNLRDGRNRSCTKDQHFNTMRPNLRDGRKGHVPKTNILIQCDLTLGMAEKVMRP